MKVRSILAQNNDQHILAQVHRLTELSEIHKSYLTYNLELLISDPEKFVELTQQQNEPIWNSNIPPPPVN